MKGDGLAGKSAWCSSMKISVKFPEPCTVCNPSTVVALPELACHQPSSGFSKRPCFEKKWGGEW